MFLSQAAIDAVLAVDLSYELLSRRPGESWLSEGRFPTRDEALRAMPESPGDSRWVVLPSRSRAPESGPSPGDTKAD
ncbi:hypothetical protein R5W24_003914 [Gemmata sp. JC717]|uniref:hypothetical protein n=1 Tax=Gemmata algarum TaxID=2975278 RepID=UPI0021BAC60F|nr:hypothetical protein [Gemmata algarum]MDY3554785.1 hypothetical protein [Gemmata algarum]